MLDKIRMLTLSRFVYAVRKANKTLARLRIYACNALMDEEDLPSGRPQEPLQQQPRFSIPSSSERDTQTESKLMVLSGLTIRWTKCG